MEIIRYADLKAQPWQNGGGVTRELASSPAADAGGDTAVQPGSNWRVSITEVSKAGDFPAFPGTDRVLTVIDGELLLLSVDGTEQPLERYRPFRFSGDADSAGTLPTGDVRNLNVITRKGAFKGYTSIVELSKKRAHPVFAGQWAILLQGQATVSPGTAGGSSTPDSGAAAPQQPEPAVDLNRYDAVAGSDTATPEILGRGFLAVVSIDRIADAAESLPGTD